MVVTRMKSVMLYEKYLCINNARKREMDENERGGIIYITQGERERGGKKKGRRERKTK